MNGNGRLTAPPRDEAVLVTNSVSGTQRNSARGFSLELLDTFASPGTSPERPRRPGGTAGVPREPEPGPVLPAPQLLSFFAEVAARA